MLRSWCVLYILTLKRASRYSGVQFFLSALSSYKVDRSVTNSDNPVMTVMLIVTSANCSYLELAKVTKTMAVKFPYQTTRISWKVSKVFFVAQIS